MICALADEAVIQEPRRHLALRVGASDFALLEKGMANSYEITEFAGLAKKVFVVGLAEAKRKTTSRRHKDRRGFAAGSPTGLLGSINDESG